MLTQPQLLPISLSEMIAEIEREMLARKRLYPVRIANKRLSQGTADRRMGTLEAVLILLQALRDRGTIPEGLPR